jgi:hypothetical protein
MVGAGRGSWIESKLVEQAESGTRRTAGVAWVDRNRMQLQWVVFSGKGLDQSSRMVWRLKAQCAGVRLQLQLQLPAEERQDQRPFTSPRRDDRTTPARGHTGNKRYTRCKHRRKRTTRLRSVVVSPAHPPFHTQLFSLTSPPPPASVSAPCRDQPCLTSATSALAPTDAPDTLHYTLTHSLRPTSPDGACLSLPRESGYEHSTTRPLHTFTVSDTDTHKATDRVIALHSAHLHFSNKERPPATL